LLYPLIYFSDPAAEEAETELKASALIDAILRPDSVSDSASVFGIVDPKIDQHDSAPNRKVLLIDHEDSFVHTLANYLRQTGAEVVTCRSGASLKTFMKERMDTGIFSPDITVLSPGPGSPSDFQLKETIDAMIARKIPIFGVCLGLQGLVEYFGGELGILGYPMHGKPSIISRSFADDEEKTVSDSAYGGPEVHDVLRGLPSDFQVARYHSLHGKKLSLPKELIVTATSPDDVIMAIQHATMPIAAVQFHPESILTLPKHGMRIITNALEILKSEHYN
jgi:anthranilate synthase